MISKTKHILEIIVIAAVVILFMTAEKSPEEDIPQYNTSSEQNYINGYSLTIDGHFIAATRTSNDISQALNLLLKSVCQSNDVSAENSELLNNFSIDSGLYEYERFVTKDTLCVLLGIESDISYKCSITDYSGKVLDVIIQLGTRELRIDNTQISYDTEYTVTVNDKNDVIVSEGKNGILMHKYMDVYINGELKYTKLIKSSITAIPVNRVIAIPANDKRQFASLKIFKKPYDGRISSGYGYRYLGGTEFHPAIDIIAFSGSCYGDEIYAAANGTVIESQYSGGYGLKIVIEHDDGYKTIYGHLSKSAVEPGQTVKAGEVIGYIGATGRVTGPHLHFEILKEDVNLNPELYISEPYKSIN